MAVRRLANIASGAKDVGTLASTVQREFDNVYKNLELGQLSVQSPLLYANGVLDILAASRTQAGVLTAADFARFDDAAAIALGAGSVTTAERTAWNAAYAHSITTGNAHSIRLDQVNNPTSAKTFSFTDKNMAFTFADAQATGSYDGAFELDFIGSIQGDCFHVHQSAGSIASPNTDLVHFEVASTNINVLRLVKAAGTPYLLMANDGTTTIQVPNWTITGNQTILTGFMRARGTITTAQQSLNRVEIGVVSTVPRVLLESTAGSTIWQMGNFSNVLRFVTGADVVAFQSDDSGNMIIKGTVKIGTNPAAGQQLNLGNYAGIAWRNVANSADAGIMWFDNSNNFLLRNDTAGGNLYFRVSTGSGMEIRAGSVNPEATSSLGLDTDRWAGVFSTTANFSSTITLGNGQLTPASGQLFIIGTATGVSNISFLQFTLSNATAVGGIGDFNAGANDITIIGYTGSSVLISANSTARAEFSGASANNYMRVNTTFDGDIIGTTTKGWYTNFTTGIFGSGFRLDYNSSVTGASYLEIDNVVIRNSLRTHIFQYDVVRATNGYLFISDTSEIVKDTDTSDATLYIYTKENVFQAGDLVWYKDIDMSTGLAITGIKIVIATVDGSQALGSGKNGFRYTYTISSGTGTFKVGGTVVRVGGSAATRQGSIYFDASGSYAPYMDIYDQITSWSAFGSPDLMKVRLGKLTGITDSLLGTLGGYGIHTRRGFFAGDVHIYGELGVSDNDGSGISTNFFAGNLNKNEWKFDSRLATTWSKSTTDVTFADNVTTDPEGIASSASSVSVSGSPSSWFGDAFNTDSSRAGKTYVASLWVRTSTGTENFTIEFYDDAGAHTVASFTATTAWRRFSGVYTYPGSGTYFGVYFRSSTQPITYYVYGIQMERVYSLNTGAGVYIPKGDVTTYETSGRGMWASNGGFAGTLNYPMIRLGASGMFVRNVGTGISGSHGVQIGKSVATFSGGLPATYGSNFGLFGYNAAVETFAIRHDGTAQIAGWVFDSDKIASTITNGAGQSEIIKLARTPTAASGTGADQRGNCAGLTVITDYSGGVAYSLRAGRGLVTTGATDWSTPTATGGSLPTETDRVGFQFVNYKSGDGEKVLFEVSQRSVASQGGVDGYFKAVIAGWKFNSSQLWQANAILSSVGYVSFGATPPTSYGNNVGTWIGYSSGAKMSLYSDANNYLQWDGSALTAGGGTITGGTIRTAGPNTTRVALSGSANALQFIKGNGSSDTDVLSFSPSNLIFFAGYNTLQLNTTTGSNPPSLGIGDFSAASLTSAERLWLKNDKVAMYMYDSGSAVQGIVLIGANPGTTAATAAFSADVKTILSGGINDGFTAGIELYPRYDGGGGSYVVARHNYFYMRDVVLTNSATVTNSCVFYFNAAIGTHKAIASGSTKANPGSVQAWMKININGTLYYMPCYSSTA